MQLPSDTGASGLRILVVAQPGAGTSAFLGWLAEFDGVADATTATPDMVEIEQAQGLHPHVVLLDFHRIPVSTACVVARVKAWPSKPAVFVLTHDASEVMRRRCLEVGADGIFDKTAELEVLRYVLGVHGRVHCRLRISDRRPPATRS